VFACGSCSHQQYGHVDGGDHSSDAAAAAAIAAAAAAAAAGAEVAASQAMAAITDPTAQGDAAAQAAAEAQAAAQLAQLNAEAAQQAAQVSQQQIDLLAQAHTLALDPATLAAMQALPVSGGLPAQALQLDPNLAATLVAQGLQIPGFTTVVDQNGNMQLMGTEGLQLGHGAEMYMTQGHEDYGEEAGSAAACTHSLHQRLTGTADCWCKKQCSCILCSCSTTAFGSLAPGCGGRLQVCHCANPYLA